MKRAFIFRNSTTRTITVVFAKSRKTALTADAARGASVIELDKTVTAEEAVAFAQSQAIVHKSQFMGTQDLAPNKKGAR